MDATVTLGPIQMVACRGVDPYGTGGTCPPNVYEGGT